ncbi:hypothetical protein C8250_027985 [Streptomyces sp. So13.3]|uniref:hypothetical protein n=1 Tax=Streptomyces TaxID=1883 RepID=UPI0011062F97|nr:MULTISPECIES: hypothetical protein [Streptomyces]MCZ4095881.1 hypothetical protein [Streptomyces sp. H39-C1]QNA75219.1 hypothetical protein C8250_027985 [Streptomyces sp. So13.3]
MNTFLGLLAATALILLVALPALIGFRVELRISRQIRAARAAERRHEEQSASALRSAEPTRGAFSPVV